MENITSIQITRETRDMLKEVGKKGETYDQIIRRLIELWRTQSQPQSQPQPQSQKQ